MGSFPGALCRNIEHVISLNVKKPFFHLFFVLFEARNSILARKLIPSTLPARKVLMSKSRGDLGVAVGETGAVTLEGVVGESGFGEVWEEGEERMEKWESMF